MNITKAEFSQFSVSSQKALISEKGIAIARLKISDEKEIRVYLIFNFFVEVLFCNLKNEIKNINLNVSGISTLFLE